MNDVSKKQLVELARECWDHGRVGRSFEGLAQARALLAEAQAVGDAEAEAECNRCIGWFCLQLGYPKEGVQAADAARNYFSQTENDWGHALSLAVYSWLILELGLSDISFETSSEAVVIASRTGDPALQSFALNCKAVALVICNERALASQMLTEALDLAYASGDESTIALTLVNRSYALLSAIFVTEKLDPGMNGEQVIDEAIKILRAAADVSRAAGDLWNLSVALCNRAELSAYCGHYEQALKDLVEAETLPGKPGPRARTHMLYTRGEVFRNMGRIDEALAAYVESERIASQNSIFDQIVQSLQRLADVWELKGDFARALSFHRSFHAAYIRQSNDRTRQRALVIEMQLANDKLRKRTEELEMQAGVDPLTEIPNRRAFNSAFETIGHEKSSLAILDIDHFKLVNDQYSHMVGDAVLRRIAQLLRTIDGGMLPYRIGGEEFGLLFPNLSLESAAPLAWKITAAVRDTDFSDLAPGLKVTVSIGLVETGILSGPQLLAEADRRLYVAKKAGRDQVIADGRSSVAALPAE